MTIIYLMQKNASIIYIYIVKHIDDLFQSIIRPLSKYFNIFEINKIFSK